MHKTQASCMEKKVREAVSLKATAEYRGLSDQEKFVICQGEQRRKRVGI
jgi:hypothetical protein